MKMIGEYLSMLPSAWKNREQVVEGIINSVKNKMHLLQPDEEEEIIRRRLICETCIYNSKNAKEEGYKSDRLDDHCIHCSCPIITKTACISCNCGIEYYNQNNPDKQQLELKWVAKTN